MADDASRAPTTWTYIRFVTGLILEIGMLFLRWLGVEIETLLILAPFTLMGWDVGTLLKNYLGAKG